MKCSSKDDEEEEVFNCCDAELRVYEKTFEEEKELDISSRRPLWSSIMAKPSSPPSRSPPASQTGHDQWPPHDRKALICRLAPAVLAGTRPSAAVPLCQ